MEGKVAVREASDEIIGKKVRIKSCEAKEHGDNDGCVCELIGQVHRISKKYESMFVGTASYHLSGRYRYKTVRRREVILLRDQGWWSNLFK